MVSIDCSVYDYMRAYRIKGDTCAVVRGTRKTSFPKLFKQIDRVAGGLAALGVGKGDVVMIALPSIEQSVAAFYAVSRLGAVAAMVHPKLSKKEYARAVREQKPKVVFLSDVNIGKFDLSTLGARKVYCPFGIASAYSGLPHATAFEPYRGDGSEITVQMRSGGTSGEPKTVCLSARAVNALVSNLLSSLGDKFSEKDAMLAALPLFHGFGLIVGVHASLCTNMTSVLLPIFKTKRAIAAIKRSGITTMIAIPRMLRKLLDDKRFNGDAISSLIDVYVGGDLVDDRLEAEFNARLKESGSSGRMSAGYGLTEVGSVCALQRDEFRKGSTGRPLGGVDAIVVDEELNNVADGEAGELLLCTDQSMDFYLGDSEDKQSYFIEKDGKEWLRTGDLFIKDSDGYLFFMGRKKRLIKISGMNVFPSEIEKTAKELEFVSECAAIERKMGDKTYIILYNEGILSEKQVAELRQYIAEGLSRWHEPKFVVCMDKIPRTPLGKIDFVRLNNEHQ